MEGSRMEGIVANGCGDELKESREEERADQGTEASGGGTGLGGGGLVGAYVVRNSSGIGRFFLGKVVSYDDGSKLYNVMYEDGHQEDLEAELVRKILMEEGAGGKLTRRKRRLDQIVPVGGLKRPNTRSRTSISDIPASSCQLSPEDVSGDGDSSSNSCDHALVPAAVQDTSYLEMQISPLELPPSSGDICVPEISVAYLFSTYNFLRSFSMQLFLSPFGFDDYVGSLNSTVQNSLMDAIHLCLLRALGRHLQILSSEGSELANKCLTCYDWTLLDVLTWPAFLVEYLYVMGHLKELDSKECVYDVLDSEYYCIPVATKVKVLQLICDDVMNSVELRAELEMRESMEEDSDICLDSNVPFEGETARVHHKSSMITALKDAGVSGESVALGNNVVGTIVSEFSADASTTAQDKNSDECCLCGMDGTLVCCDGCPSAYHSRCIGLNKAFLPEGLWFCPECNVNRLGPTSSRIGRGIRGAEIFGIDPNGSMFMGACNYLLVLDSLNDESICRYYNRDDIPKVLDSISTEASAFAYIDICRRISEYFDLPFVSIKYEKMEFRKDTTISNSSNTSPSRVVYLQNNLGYNSMCSTILGNSRNDIPMADGNEAQVATSIIRQVGISDSEMNLTGHDEVYDNRIPETAEEILVQLNNENLASGPAISEDQRILSSMHFNKREQPCFDSASTDFSNSNKPLFSEKSILLNNISCSPKNGRDICKEDAVGSIYSTKNYRFFTCESKNLDVTQKKTSERNTRVSFKHMLYINQYVQGDIAASAAARLAILSSEDTYTSSNPRRAVSASIAAQMKAFSGAVMNFLWPCFDKKLMDVPRERCGWCIACKGMSTNKKGCLLNLAASNAIKGPARNINLRASKRYEGHLQTIAAHMLIMGENLHGFLIGPFLDVEYNKQWHEQVREAPNCWSLKSLLLELEMNIRGIAFSGGWNKLMDEFTVESPILSNGVCHTGQNEKHVHSARRGKKQPELMLTSSENDGNHVLWWRGGKLSKVIFQMGTLPTSLAKKSARQGGKKKISGVPYPGCSSHPRRSRQFAWRAAVELCRTTYQLALQVRYLDAHIRWKEFIRPEQTPSDSKGSETDLMVFRNASISDKKILDNNILFALSFGDQKHLPLRITKNIVESEKTQDENDKLWFSEDHLPLYLIKEYEEKVEKNKLLSTLSRVQCMPQFCRRQLKVYWGDIFAYLMQKGEKQRKCSSCQKDVCLRYAIKCKACQDYCHLDCTAPSSGNKEDSSEFSIMCMLCHFAKTSALTEGSRAIFGTNSSLQGHCQLPLPGKKVVLHTGLQNTSLLASKPEVTSESRSSTICTDSKAKRSIGTILTHGIIWKKKRHSIEACQKFRMENIILKAKGGSYPLKEPICYLCQKPYNSNLMYVCCEKCRNWFHADAVHLDEANVFDVVGFKCGKCRRKASAKCPYSEIGYAKLEELEKHDNTAESNDAIRFPSISGSLTATRSSSEIDNFVSVEYDPLLSFEGDEPIDETALEMEVEHNSSSPSSKGLQKLPMRRSNVKQQFIDDSYTALTGIPLQHTPTETPVSASCNMPASLEWDGVEFNAPRNFDAENIYLEEDAPDQELDIVGDIEYEPQTYFSFTELLASADDAPVDMEENWGVPIDISCHNLSGMDEIIVSEESPFDDLVCQKCKLNKPSPDLMCEICLLCIHSHCSPWVEESDELSTGTNWRCGNCREWR